MSQRPAVRYVLIVSSLCAPVTVLCLDADRPAKFAVAAIPEGSTAIYQFCANVQQGSTEANGIKANRAVHIFIKIGTSQATLHVP